MLAKLRCHRASKKVSCCKLEPLPSYCRYKVRDARLDIKDFQAGTSNMQLDETFGGGFNRDFGSFGTKTSLRPGNLARTRVLSSVMLYSKRTAFESIIRRSEEKEVVGGANVIAISSTAKRRPVQWG